MEWKVGDKASVRHKITKEDVQQFAELTGDKNPIHLDENYAANTPFQKCIAHGMYVSSLISRVLGTKMPGPGAIYLNQTLAFKAPVYFDDEIEAALEIVKVREDKPIITIQTICYNQNQEIVVEGEAVLKVPK